MTISRRFLAIGAIGAALALPLFIVYLLVWDRTATAAQAHAKVNAGWAREQAVHGPWLVVPYVEQKLETVATPAKQVVTLREDALLIAPDDLKVAASLKPQVRKLSLFETVVYQTDLAVDASFAAPKLGHGDVDPALLDWSRAYYVLSVDDPRGFGGAIPRFRIDGRLVEAEPGSRGIKLEGGALSAPAGLTAAPAGTIRLSARLPLKGSQSVGVEGHARRLTVDLASTWPHPSFDARADSASVLPDSRTIGPQGFRAHWSTSYLAQSRPLVERASADRTTGTRIAEVRLVEPVDLYSQVERSLKYGILFIALTFLTFFTYDVVGKRRVPMLAYALVGLGLVLFFLLLLALAEYIGFTPAYALAAAALIGLIAAYSKAVLGGPARAAVIGGVLSLLYGTLYVLLQLEDYALLAGSLILFAALAVLMYVTRHVGDGEDGGEDGEPIIA
jgi:inner membrane protein